MWAAEHSHGPTRSKKFTQSVGCLGSLREGANEHYIHILRQLIEEVFKTGIADECDMMTLFFAPHPDDLRHNAGKVGIHNAGEQCPGRSFGDEVYYSNTKSANIVQSFLPAVRAFVNIQKKRMVIISPSSPPVVLIQAGKQETRFHDSSIFFLIDRTISRLFWLRKPRSRSITCVGFSSLIGFISPVHSPRRIDYMKDKQFGRIIQFRLASLFEL